MANNKIEHPGVRMQLELESVDKGWRRIWQCPICGLTKFGHTGKTVNTRRMTMYCDGLKASQRAKDCGVKS